MGRIDLSRTLNHRTLAIRQYANDRTIHAAFERNHLFAADKKCVEAGEIVRCIVANGMVAAALETVNTQTISIGQSEPGWTKAKRFVTRE